LKQLLNFLMRHPLLKGRPLYAFARFVNWQIRSRISSKPVIFNWIGGSRLWLRRGWSGLTGNYYAGLSDFEEMSFLLHILRPGDLFVDVGANMGSYTVLASSVCRAHAIAYEPVDSTFLRLESNIRLNQVEDLVMLRKYAVGERADMVLMTTGHDTTNHIVTMGVSTTPVQLVTLDDDLPAVPILIKIDVEGFESAVLRGAKRILSDPKLNALIIELNGAGSRYGESDDQIHACLLGYGFKPFRYSPVERRLIPLASYGENNALYLRDIDFIGGRLREASPVKVLGRSI
jgi:FkbM family methyltransferase